MSDAFAFTHDIDGQLRTREWDHAIALLAMRQHGVVAHAQLVAMGLGRGAIEHRLRTGRLHRIYRGVYSVGHRILTPDGWRMAAALAGGSDAVISCRAALVHWGLASSARTRIDVTVPRRMHKSGRIQWHYARLRDDEVTRLRGVPVTTVSRTIFDVAATGSRGEVERAIHEAEIRRLGDRVSLHELLQRYPRRPGSPLLQEILARRNGGGVPRNVFEDAFAAFIDRHRLPRPERNVWLTLGRHRYEIDCLWRPQRIALELDGRAAHDTTNAYESDRQRDRRLSVAEWRPIRVTWLQLRDEEADLAADLRDLLYVSPK